MIELMETVNNLRPQINVPDWVALPHETRRKLVQQFNIPRSGGSEVQTLSVGNRIISDGHTHQDLKAISLPKLQEFLGSISDDFYTLLEQAIEKLTNKTGPTSEQILEQKISDKLTHFSYVLSTLKREAEELGISDKLNNLVTLAFGEPKKLGRPRVKQNQTNP